MKMKSIFASVLAAALLGAAAVPAHAASGYSGPLDPETGEPAQSSSDVDAYSDRVTVSEGVYYDRTRLGFLYTVSDGLQLLCTAADGMVTQKEVSIEPDVGVEVTVYQNGTALTEPDLTHIYEVGEYVVEAAVNGQRYQVVAFSIVGDVTCSLVGYTMPNGFAITDATLDDQETYYERNYVSMTQEGHYVVDYRCVRSGVTYELDITVDTTPPVLTISGLDENNQARGPVTLADIEDGASIGITLDGKQISYSSELTESGEYQIVLMDKAGNVSRYAFTILVYFDLNSLLFLGIVGAVAAAVIAYIVISRKKLEVR